MQLNERVKQLQLTATKAEFGEGASTLNEVRFANELALRGTVSSRLNPLAFTMLMLCNESWCCMCLV